MFSYWLKSGDPGSSALSRTEQRPLYVAGVFFVLTMVFSAFSIASTVLSAVSLSDHAETAIAAGTGVATALVAALLGYWIDRKAMYTREKHYHLLSAARPLLPGAIFAVAVFLAVIATIASESHGGAFLSALAGGTLCVAGLFGCLFVTRYRARAARQA